MDTVSIPNAFDILMPPKSKGSAQSEEKLPLPQWLKAFTEKGVDMRLAMTLAAKLYPTNSSMNAIVKLTGPKLESAGITEKDQKRVLLNAIRAIKTNSSNAVASSSKSGASPDGVQAESPRPYQNKKRKAQTLEESYMSPGELAEKRRRETTAETFDFREVDDLETIRDRSVTTNRAPCMTAWAFVICEKMGFDRQEALSLASVFTSVTSTQHALSLGNIYTPEQTRDAQKEMEDQPKAKRRRLESNAAGAVGVTGAEEQEEEGHAQPWVGVMKRSALAETETSRRPVIQLSNGSYRAISKGMAVGPEKGYAYIIKNFKNVTPYVIGAMRALAASFELDVLDETGYGMYCHFRPEVEEWGERATLYCGNILDLIPDSLPGSSLQTALRISEGEAEAEAAATEFVKEEEDIKPIMKPEDKPVRPGGEDISHADQMKVKEEDRREVEIMALAQADINVKEEPREDVFEGLWEDEWDGE